MRRYPLSLRTELVLGLALLSLGVLGALHLMRMHGLPALGIVSSAEQGRQDALRAVGLAADLQKQQLSRWLEERRKDVRLLATDPALSRDRIEDGGRGTQAALEERLQRVLATHRLYGAAWLLDGTSGQVLAQVPRSAPSPSSFVSRPHPSGGLEPFGLEIVESSVSKQPVLRLGHAVSGAGPWTTPVFAVLEVDLARAPVPQELPSLGRSAESVLLGADARVLSPLKHPMSDGSPATTLGDRLRTPAGLLVTQGEEGGVRALDYRGAPVLAAVRTIQLPGGRSLGLVVKVDEAEALLMAQNLAQSALRVHAAAALLVVLMGYLFVSWRTRAIAPLTAAARAVQTGRFDTEIDVSGSRDIAQLGQAFGLMLGKLRRWGAEFETRIAERTAELKLANRLLRREIVEHREAKAHVLHLNSVLNAIRMVNQAIVSETDGPRLAQRACDILLAARGYRCIWVGLRTETGGIERAGLALAEDIPVAVRDLFARGGLPRCALDETLGSTAITEHGGAHCSGCPLAESADPATTLLAPIAHQTRCFGTMVVWTTSASTDEDERVLVSELASDLALGLHSIYQRQQKERLRHALGVQEHLQRTLISASPDAIILTDGEGKVVQASGQAVCLYGVPDEQALLDLTFDDLFLAGDVSGTELLERVHTEGRIAALPLLVQREGTAPCPVEASFAAVAHDRTQGVLVVVRDVSGRVEMEAQLHGRQRLEAVGRLAGGVAHDFNNVLTAIRSYGAFALESIPPSDPVREDVCEILEAAERATNLVRQLLAFSRRQVLRTEVVDLNLTVDSIRRMLERLIGEDVELHTVLAEDLWQVRADVAQVEQILVNLAINARDAMPRGGHLTIETFNTVLDGDYARARVGVKPGEYVAIVVSDTGVGIPAEVAPHIFEPFFTTKPKGEGTGLGLATVYGIVKQSGGNVWAYSEGGLGASFKVFLPRCLDTPVPAVQHSQCVRKDAGSAVDPDSSSGISVQPRRAGGELVLLAEDDAVVRRAICRMLERAGYEVVTAASGAAAMEQIAKEPRRVDLLISDVIMPQMGGRELAHRVLRTHPHLQILFISGYADSAIQHHGLLELGTHFLAKPFGESALLHKIHEILHRDRAARAG